MIDRKRRLAFWSKVDRTPGFGPNGNCWMWTKGKNKWGYGQFYIKDRKKCVQAQRVAYTIVFLNGIFPESHIFVCHRCDNPACVRPGHLFLGTAKDNVDDMMSKGRKAEMIVENALRDHQVWSIKNSTKTNPELANEFKVSTGTIQRARNSNKAYSKYKMDPNPNRNLGIILNEDQVRIIKIKIALGQELVEIAKEFGTVKSNLTAINKGRSWNDVVKGLPIGEIRPAKNRFISNNRLCRVINDWFYSNSQPGIPMSEFRSSVCNYGIEIEKFFDQYVS